MLVASIAFPTSAPPAAVRTDARPEAPKKERKRWLDAPWGDLKAEADRICGQSQVAPKPGVGEIRALLADSTALREALLRAEGPPAEALLERFETCEYSLSKAEFDRICGQVQVAPTLGEEAIRALLEDCAALRERLLRAKNPQAKVLLKRLKMCEAFFEYSLELLAAD